MGGEEEKFVREAFATNWFTVGPQVTAFETEFSDRIGSPAVALATGTAAIHLALRLLGVGPGDEVICPTMTFVASINPAIYLGAKPIFVDCDPASWNIDPCLLIDLLEELACQNRLPKAVVVVHLYGQSADMDPILDVCGRYGVPVMEDAAEALGALYKGKPVGTLGSLGAFSFNGNKIITASGGGMLISKNVAWLEKARFWSTQARDPSNAYLHSEVGYNYRLSNVLAAIGRGQLLVLGERVRRRSEIAFAYCEAFADLAGIALMPQADYGLHTNWLSCFLVDEKRFGCDRDGVGRALSEAHIEWRPLWQPMHLQPLFRGIRCLGGTVAEDLFRRGLCLPSSSNLTYEEQMRVIAAVRSAAKKHHM